VLGIATAVTIDAAALGYEEVPLEREELQNVGVPVGRGGAVISAGGTFYRRCGRHATVRRPARTRAARCGMSRAARRCCGNEDASTDVE
jgi:hypothetical protein